MSEHMVQAVSKTSTSDICTPSQHLAMLDHGKSARHVYTTISNAILLLAACLSQAQVPFAFLPGSDKLTTNGCSVRLHQEPLVGQALVACLQQCLSKPQASTRTCSAQRPGREKPSSTWPGSSRKEVRGTKAPPPQVMPKVLMV